jgi:hypothetical protein
VQVRIDRAGGALHQQVFARNPYIAHLSLSLSQFPLAKFQCEGGNKEIKNKAATTTKLFLDG